MNLHNRLVLIMISLLVLAVMALFTLNQFSQVALVREIQDSSQEISKAVQMSIADLTSSGSSSQLAEYYTQARQKGVSEINIIDERGQIVNSTNPEKIGKIKDLKKLEKGVRSAPRKSEGGTILSQKLYDVVVPVIVGDEHLGYVQVNMLLDNIQNIQRLNFIKRLAATAMVFTVGIAFSVYLSRRYTDPIHRLVSDFKKVSGGDLSVTIPVTSDDEVGELAKGFNEMVEKLRERKELEQRLYKAEHLSKVGQLASGIAHEIRNPLNYISLAIDHLQGEITSVCTPEKAAELVGVTDTIRDEVRRANYMVVNFMNYGRPLKLRLSDVRYDELLERSITTLQTLLDEHHIAIQYTFGPELPLLRLDPELMRNCIINFISNAAQAMPEGGTLTFSAAVDDREVPGVVLGFSDTGCGIAAEHLEHVFQPYFTTKDVGIGLGLAITERVIREHGGTVQVTSTLGRGTTFNVWIPRGEGTV